ncbi:hypothetical protein GCM10009092_16130 [Bowmanella denitrificans]|uniref:Uncharacterized protein n=1 Tax=Bowmanella denitrificans TaxID=366582 RepID=A0ABN0X1F6_9ALTE
MQEPLTIPANNSPWKRALLLTTTAAGLAILIWLVLLLGQQLSPAAPADLKVAQADWGPVQARVSGYGRLSAVSNTSVIAQVEGVIADLKVYPGTTVKKGDLLVQLQSPRLVRQLAQARLDWYQAQAEYQSALVDIERQGMEVKKQLDVAGIDVEMARQELDILTQLKQKQIVSELEHQRATAILAKATLQLTQAQQSYTFWQQALSSKRQAAEYTLKAAEEKLDIARQDIDKLNIYATKDGILNSLGEQVELGKVAREGDVLGVILDPDMLMADVFVSAADALHLTLGMAAEVSMLSGEFSASVYRIYPKVENNLMQVTLAFDAPLPAAAKDNMELSASILVADIAHSLRLPLPAYPIKANSENLFYVQQGQDYIRQPLATGLVGQHYVQVLHGIEAQQKVLIQYPPAWQNKPRITQKDMNIE